MVSKLDLDFYEKVVVYHCLTDEVYLGSIIDHISPDYFSNPNVTCKNGSACGVLNVSDNAKWYNNLGTRFSNILRKSRFQTCATIFINFYKVKSTHWATRAGPGSRF